MMISYSAANHKTNPSQLPSPHSSAEFRMALELTDILGFPTAFVCVRTRRFYGNGLFVNLMGPQKSVKTEVLLQKKIDQAATTLSKASPHHLFGMILGGFPHVVKLCIWRSGFGQETSELIYVATAYRLSKISGLLPNCLPELFELTRKESELAVAIASGTSIAGIARNTAVAEGTVRDQLKSVYRKVGVRGQTELCAVMRPSPFSLASAPLKQN